MPIWLRMEATALVSIISEVSPLWLSYLFDNSVAEASQDPLLVLL